MSEIVKINQHILLPPGTFGSIDPALVKKYATKAAGSIKYLGGGHMFHPSANTLQAYLLHGLATCTLEHGHVSGFIKLDPWVIYPNGKPADMGEHGAEAVLDHIDQGLAHMVGLESGSLVVPWPYQSQGQGTMLKQVLSQHALKTFPDLPVFSVVTNDNAPSLHVNHKLGWLPISPKQSLALLKGVDVLDGWEPPSTIFIHPDSLNWGHWQIMGMEPPPGCKASQVTFGGPLCR